MATKKWKMSRDPLFRGDRKEYVSRPVPLANPSIVRHVLFLEGPGRDTPYLSTTEEYEIAEHFANNGQVWQTYVKEFRKEGVRHISKSELLRLMKGNGQGKAKWKSAYEVMQARRYVEQWGEHLLDFREVTEVDVVVDKIFCRS